MLDSVMAKWAAFDPLIGVGIFVAYMLIDALYARWTFEITRLDEYRAATTGAIMHILLAFGVLNYTGNYLYVVPLVLGSAIGTFFYVRAERLRVAKISLKTVSPMSPPHAPKDALRSLLGFER